MLHFYRLATVKDVRRSANRQINSTQQQRDVVFYAAGRVGPGWAGLWLVVDQAQRGPARPDPAVLWLRPGWRFSACAYL